MLINVVLARALYKDGQLYRARLSSRGRWCCQVRAKLFGKESKSHH